MSSASADHVARSAVRGYAADVINAWLFRRVILPQRCRQLLRMLRERRLRQQKTLAACLCITRAWQIALVGQQWWRRRMRQRQRTHAESRIRRWLMQRCIRPYQDRKTLHGATNRIQCACIAFLTLRREQRLRRRQEALARVVLKTWKSFRFRRILQERVVTTQRRLSALTRWQIRYAAKRIGDTLAAWHRKQRRRNRREQNAAKCVQRVWRQHYLDLQHRRGRLIALRRSIVRRKIQHMIQQWWSRRQQHIQKLGREQEALHGRRIVAFAMLRTHVARQRIALAVGRWWRRRQASSSTREQAGSRLVRAFQRFVRQHHAACSSDVPETTPNHCRTPHGGISLVPVRPPHERRPHMMAAVVAAAMDLNGASPRESNHWRQRRTINGGVIGGSGRERSDPRALPQVKTSKPVRPRQSSKVGSEGRLPTVVGGASGSSMQRALKVSQATKQRAEQLARVSNQEDERVRVLRVTPT